MRTAIKALSTTVVLLLGLLARPAAARTELQLGAGIHYWRAMSRLDSEHFDRDGRIWLFSGRYQAGPAGGFGFELEKFPAGFAAAETTIYAPALFLLAGRGLYAGLGAGTYYTSGKGFSGDYFYVMRGGLMMPVLPALVLDLHVNYRYDSWGSLSRQARDINSDTATFGFALRMTL